MLRDVLLALAILTLVGCARPQRAAVADDEPIRGLRESRREAPEFGSSLYVLEAGARDAPPVVLIHGLGASGARDFAPLLPLLSRHHRVFAFDLPGLARSERANEAYTPARYARMIQALIEQEFGRPVFVVGHSMGAAIAIELAGRHPASVARLALLDVAGVLHNRAYLRAVVAGSEERLDWFGRAERGVRELFFGVGMVVASPMKLERLAIASNETLRSFFASSTSAAVLFLQHDFGPALRAVRAPTWLGWGKHDAVAPLRTAQALRAVLRPQKVVTFKQSSHVPMRTEPQRVASALIDFFAAAEPHTTRRPERAVGREGSCERQSDRVFEGDYDSITLYGCKRVTLRNVRAGSLWIEQSQAELVDVELESPAIAAVIMRSRVRWTGGRIRAGVCLHTEGSELDFAAVDCAGTREAVRVYAPSRLSASVSRFARAGHAVSLHGEYALTSEPEGALPELNALSAPATTVAP